LAHAESQINTSSQKYNTPTEASLSHATQWTY